MNEYNDEPIDISPDGEVYTMLAQNEGAQNEGTGQESDVYSMLAQKERDLILAAELGKALLEKNQELAIRHQQLIEEYSQKIEQLEQEKHELHLRIEKIEREYENTVKELQYDISQLRQELYTSKMHSAMSEKEHSQLIRELTQHNEKLTEQVRQASIREEQLENKVHSMRQQMSSRRSSMHEHVSQLAILREEVQLLMNKKAELERRIGLLSEEKESFACSLEESHERIMKLERQRQEKDQAIMKQGGEIAELQEANALLQAEIDSLFDKQSNLCYAQAGQSSCTETNTEDQPQTLFSELTQLSGMTMSQENATELGLSRWSRSYQVFDEEEEEFECDDDDQFSIPMGKLASSSMISETDFISEFQQAAQKHFDSEEEVQMKDEVMYVYKHLKKMIRTIRGQSTGSIESLEEESADKGARTGQLKSTFSELQHLMQDVIISDMTQEPAAVDESSFFSMEMMQKNINELEMELDMTQRHLQHVQAEMAAREDQTHDKDTEFMAMVEKVQLQHQQEKFVQLQSERDELLNGMYADIAKDEILAQTRKDRDEAIERGHQLEMELAKAKHDLMTLNSQLVDSMQHKTYKSSQINKWKENMQDVLHYQMHNRLRHNKHKNKMESRGQDEMKKSKSASSLPSGRKT
ncbi:bicaudal D-related protein homolog isoform X2 [Gigantopelta aegis]|uniref:bicaudal D-related protein homolog isoform X2 n=1 Tax=Gigantopelta aegis TaxID=1735272 RepID=UPI001B88DEA4|nr:bicaudal D-related protein homolog isoform X2 [Gigantopelta aegis]